MRALKLVHEDDEVEVYEEEWLIEATAGQRPLVRLRYDGLNAFLGHYLGRIRRAESLTLEAPRSVSAGELLDVEIAVDDAAAFTLHAQVLSRLPEDDSELTEVQFFAGALTDRVVMPLLERALGARHAAALLAT